MSLLSTMLALSLGIAIAYRTAKSITEPLTNLMNVARGIGNTGDLEHNIEINRDDEIGELARTFNKMVTYLKEMAGSLRSPSPAAICRSKLSRALRTTRWATPSPR